MLRYFDSSGQICFPLYGDCSTAGIGIQQLSLYEDWSTAGIGIQQFSLYGDWSTAGIGIQQLSLSKEAYVLCLQSQNKKLNFALVMLLPLRDDVLLAS